MIHKKEHGIDIQSNENSLSHISKRKCYDNEKTDANLLFVFPFSYKYNAEDEVTNMFNELHGKEYSL